MSESRPLKTVLDELGMSQENLAQKLGCKHQTVNKWCNRGDPRASSLIRIADALHCSVDRLLGRSLSSVSTKELLTEVARRTGTL